jgi:fucose 4-O-acetylase-like acetyltransferase
MLSEYFSSLGGYLALSRLFVYAPFFLLGRYLRDSGFDFRKYITRHAKIVAAAAVIAFYLSQQITPFIVEHNFLFGSEPYVSLGHYEWYAGIYRIFYYAVNLVMCAAFFVLVPQKRYSWSKLGTNTISVYLLHGFVMLYIGQNAGRFNSWLDVPLAFALTAAMTFGFSLIDVPKIVTFGYNRFLSYLVRFHRKELQNGNDIT